MVQRIWSACSDNCCYGFGGYERVRMPLQDSGSITAVFQGGDTMDFDQIMSEITAGLTGDEAKDIPYLEEQAERYKDSEYAMEVGRACGRLLFEIIPEEKREELDRLLQKQGLAVDATLDEVRFNIYI